MLKIMSISGLNYKQTLKIIIINTTTTNTTTTTIIIKPKTKKNP